VAQAIWGRFVDLNAACEVRLHRDGSIELFSSVQDIGTGTRTALAQVVGEELGVPASVVQVRIGDTHFPAGPSSGGSKTLLAITAPARTAAWRCAAQLKAAAAERLGVPADTLLLHDGRVASRDGSASLPLKDAAARLRSDYVSAQASRAPDYGGDPHDGYGGVQFVEVAVDVETGVVKVERVVAVHDCGRVINPLAVQSQINGGGLHAVSWALYERRQLDHATGRMVNANLDQYKIAGARETPRIEVVLLDQIEGRNATDANGIGEPANIATAAAIANAVYNAVGVRVRELPLTPATVLAALAKKERP
jgi:xanthine dehydrogenase YagR molybdenum-binding subunit